MVQTLFMDRVKNAESSQGHNDTYNANGVLESDHHTENFDSRIVHDANVRHFKTTLLTLKASLGVDDSATQDASRDQCPEMTGKDFYA